MAAKIDRLGETRMMNCGMEATIIRYGGATDIDVRFEDGPWQKIKRMENLKKVELLIQVLQQKLALAKPE